MEVRPTLRKQKAVEGRSGSAVAHLADMLGVKKQEPAFWGLFIISGFVMIRKILTFCKNFQVAYNKKNLTDCAASAAFFLFLSLIPLLMIFFAVIPRAIVSVDTLIDLANKHIPANIADFVVGIIREIYQNSTGIITISIIFTLMSSGKGMQALVRGMNKINGISEKRNFFVMRFWACIYTMILLAAIIIMMVLMMFGRELYHLAALYFPFLQSMKNLFLRLRYPLSGTVLILIFDVLYCFLPSTKQKFMAELPGAVTAAIIWLITSWGFSTYLKYYDFSAYGSLAMIVVVLLYLYMMMYIMLFGAYLNHWLGRSVTKKDKLMK